MAVVLSSLEPLVADLRARGYTVVGPTLSAGAIVLAELESAADLPAGWGVDTGPGSYRLRRRADRAAFGHSAGPQAWKRFLHPPREPLWSADRNGDDVTFTEPDAATPTYAFLGVRPCDLRAIAVQDRVLGASASYAKRRRETFIIAVNCTEPSATCFCVSAGGGPAAQDGFDLALTELTDPDDDPAPRYVVVAGSDKGSSVLTQLPHRPAEASLVSRAEQAVSGLPVEWDARCPMSTCERCWRAAARPQGGTTWRAAALPVATAPWRVPRASVRRSPIPPI
jgi:hypothetical protein